GHVSGVSSLNVNSMGPDQTGGIVELSIGFGPAPDTFISRLDSPARPGMIAEPTPERPSQQPPRKRSVQEPSGVTLAERFILAFHLPYEVGCILAGVILFGILTTVLSTYAGTSDTSVAIRTALSPAGLSFDFLVAYSFYVPHYMRNRLVEAGTSLSTLLPDRVEGYRRIFGRLGSL